MLSTVKSILIRVMMNKKLVFFMGLTVFILFFLKSGHAFAAGTDIGAGTADDAIATESGSGKRWLYVIEGAVAGYGFIKTRNIAVLGGVFVLSLFINVVLNKFING
jgi:hypothetical protein